MNLITASVRKLFHGLHRLRQLVRDEDHDPYYEDHPDPNRERRKPPHGGFPTTGAT